MGHRKFRFLDWYWTRGNFNFCHPLPAETKMANIHQQSIGSNDSLRCSMCGYLFLFFHVGRVWFAWWLFPLPNWNAIWPQFRVHWNGMCLRFPHTLLSQYFFGIGMIPDLAVIRDRAKETWRKYFYGILSMGWRNANNHWRNFEMAYLLLAVSPLPWFFLFIQSFHLTLP